MYAGDTVHVPIYFLRQLRDPADGVDASPQGVVEGKIGIKVDSVSGVHLAGRHTIKLARLASHPFEEDLGLAPGVLHESALTIDATLDYDLE